MTERRLTMTVALEQVVRRHGEDTYPHECCGALVGRGDRVTEVVALPNTTEEGPRRRFLVRPSDYLAAERRARELGGDLVGFYHSHPDHPARPSQYDLDHAWPTFAYVIVAVAGAGLQGQGDDGSRKSGGDAATEGAKAGDLTVWFLSDDRSTFLEGSLHHGDNSHPDTAPAVHR
jgi:proteasome lid subunit RPN8/RPN11